MPNINHSIITMLVVIVRINIFSLLRLRRRAGSRLSRSPHMPHWRLSSRPAPHRLPWFNKTTLLFIPPINNTTTICTAMSPLRSSTILIQVATRPITMRAITPPHTISLVDSQLLKLFIFLYFPYYYEFYFTAIQKSINIQKTVYLSNNYFELNFSFFKNLYFIKTERMYSRFFVHSVFFFSYFFCYFFFILLKKNLVYFISKHIYI